MKQKTKSSAKKRVRVTKSGKLQIAKSCKNHRLFSKSKRQKKYLRKSKYLDLAPAEVKRIKRLINI